MHELSLDVEVEAPAPMRGINNLGDQNVRGLSEDV